MTDKPAASTKRKYVRKTCITCKDKRSTSEFFMYMYGEGNDSQCYSCYLNAGWEAAGRNRNVRAKKTSA